MNGKVLVAFASKYGATAEIAHRIGETLSETGVETEVRPAGEVSDVTPYRAVVLGSALYAGSWRKEAVRLLESQADALTGRPVWIFSSGPTGEGDPVELVKGQRIPEALKGVADRIRPRDLAVFHGAMHLGRLNFFERFVIKAMKAPVGDFRDWDAIAAWARGIAGSLKEGTAD